MAESLATVMAEAIEFWQTYSNMNEPAQDDIAHEKNAMLERMQATGMVQARQRLWRDTVGWESAGMSRWLAIELLASALTLAGIYAGSTTATGAALYLASLVFWYWLTAGKRLWGLMPLNIATTIVAGMNLWKALA